MESKIKQLGLPPMTKGFRLISETWKNKKYNRVGRNEDGFSIQYHEIIEDEVVTTSTLIPNELASGVVRTLVNELLLDYEILNQQ